MNNAPLHWFGKQWDAAVCSPVNHVEVPVFQKCEECEEDFRRDDQGVLIEYIFRDCDPPSVGGRSAAWHLHCLLWRVAKVV